MTNLTPAQLEQFESTFRYFDKDESNTLELAEMIAALASLGIVYSEDDMNYIYDELVRDYGAVTFEAFINLLVCPAFELPSNAYVGNTRWISWKIKHHAINYLKRFEVSLLIRCDRLLILLASSSSPILIQLLFPKPVVTELDLQLAQLPAPAIEYLRSAMPSVQNEVGEQAYEYERWLDEVFAFE